MNLFSSQSDILVLREQATNPLRPSAVPVLMGWRPRALK
jgi:hypothetical protein